jgi:hypothetical protein
MARIAEISDGRSLDSDISFGPEAVGMFPASANYATPAADFSFFVATRAVRVRAITARVDIAGSDASPVTAIIRKVPSGSLVAAGTALHSGSINLKGSGATNQALTLSTTSSDLDLAAGDALAFDLSGTATGATGSVTVTLNPRR